MSDIPHLREYGRYVDGLQSPIDVEILVRNAIVSPRVLGTNRRRRVLIAAAVFMAVVAIPIVFALVTDRATDPAEQPAPPAPDANLGYDDLAPPTTRPTFLDSAQVADGFTLHDSQNCGAGATSQVARVSANGEVLWVTEAPWLHRGSAAASGVVVGMTAAQRVSLVALDALTGTPLWQRFQDDLANAAVAVADGLVVVAGSRRGEEANVWAYELATGALRWTVPSTGRPQLVTPIGSVILAEVDRVARLDARDGSIVWERAFAEAEEITVTVQFGGNGFVADPGDQLLVRSWPATITRLDPDTGEEMWSWTAADERVYVSPYAVLEGVLAFDTGFSHGAEVGIGPTTSPPKQSEHLTLPPVSFSGSDRAATSTTFAAGTGSSSRHSTRRPVKSSRGESSMPAQVRP